MIKGARQLPTMHVSIRVPWHDGRWAGTVCTNPRGNTSCLILPRIAETKDDEFEFRVAGTAWNADGVRLPACAAERWCPEIDLTEARLTPEHLEPVIIGNGD